MPLHNLHLRYNTLTNPVEKLGQGSHLATGPVLFRSPILRLQVNTITITLFFNLIVSLLAQNCVSNLN